VTQKFPFAGHWLKESRDIQPFKSYLQYFTKAAYAIRSETSSRLITGMSTQKNEYLKIEVISKNRSYI
jgi:hypothetical protein